MNKKIILGILAVASISTIAIGQSYAANTNTSNRQKIRFEMLNAKRLHSGMNLGSGNYTGLHLGSGMKIRGSGEKPEGRSGLKLGWDKQLSGHKEQFGSGNRERLGSGYTNTGKIDKLSKKDMTLTKKIEGFISVFENMTDNKLKEMLTKVDEMITKTTNSANLTFLNAIKSLIQSNIGN